MGILKDMGPVMSYQDTTKSQPHLKRVAIRQFLNVLNKYRKWVKPADIETIKWGEEIEGHFLEFDDDGSLKLAMTNVSEQYAELDFPLMFEYGSFMFEMTPSFPYSTRFNLDEIIRSMREKYQILQGMSRMPLTIPGIPFMGVRDKSKETEFVNQITQSLYISDDHIAPHPRFITMTKSIRNRREQSLNCNVPIFMDKNTSIEEIRATGQPNDGFIHLDTTCFGLGLSCLQCTFSTKSLDHARWIYDRLNVLSPIFLALTAGIPFHKGKVADWDARWNIISGTCDDRRQSERDPKSPSYVPDSRYSSANLYIHDGEQNLPEYNDFDLKITEEEIQRVKTASEQMKIQIDDHLAKHIANIMKRDILIVHEEFPNLSQQENLLFEMLNGTNWNSVRLKIPINDDIGWRVEFRTMEVQLTPDENAAYSLMVHLITRVLHETSDLNFYIPISKLRINFERAHKNNALMAEKFYFRTNVLDKGPAQIEEMTIDEIFFGCDKFKFRGIYPMFMERIPQCVDMSPRVKILFDSIERFLKEKTSGKRLTLAQWMRNFVNNDERYKKNSILPKQVMDQMLLELFSISSGSKKDPTFAQIFDLWESDTPRMSRVSRTSRTSGRNSDRNSGRVSQ